MRGFFHVKKQQCTSKLNSFELCSIFFFQLDNEIPYRMYPYDQLVKILLKGRMSEIDTLANDSFGAIVTFDIMVVLVFPLPDTVMVNCIPASKNPTYFAVYITCC